MGRIKTWTARTVTSIALFALLSIVIGYAFWSAVKSGQYKERAKSLGRKIKIINKANKAQDRVLDDSDYRERVRRKYDGE